jgi:hypothetical protein
MEQHGTKAKTKRVSPQGHAPLQSVSTSIPMTCPDIVFSAIYVGNVDILLDVVVHLINNQRCEWSMDSVRACSLDQLRVAFFLLMDRDMGFKEQMLRGWPEINIAPMAPRKAEQFFRFLQEDVIDPWLVDERLTCGWFLEKVTDLYLVS